MEPAEAVARVEDWLRAVHGPEMSEPGGVALRVDRDRVLRVPEGWAVPYNTVAYLDEGRAEKQIFPPPSILVREPDGELRRPHPHPGGLSIPVAQEPGQEHWREIVDPLYADAGLGHLGVPLEVIAGWEKIAADGTKTGERRDNPEYRTGPLRRGYPRPANLLETLMLFLANGWLSGERFLIGLTGCEVYVPGEPDSDTAGELKVYTAPHRMPPRWHAWRKVDPGTLTVSTLVLSGGPALEQKISGTELAATLAKFPRFAPKVDVNGQCPEAGEDLVRLAADTAARLGLPEPVKPDWWLSRAEKARRRGFELTAEECRKTVVGLSWQARLRLPGPPPLAVADYEANGLAPAYGNDGRIVPMVCTFGKYFTEDIPADLPTRRFGWQRVTGAYVGFALGEALGRVVDRMSLDEIRDRFGPDGVTEFPRAGEIGPLTQRLLFYTEAVMRSPHTENPEAEARFPEVANGALLRWLHTQGVPFDKADGWLVNVPELHSPRDPDPVELAAIQALASGRPTSSLGGPAALVPALAAAATDSYLRFSGGSRQVVRVLAGLTHRDETNLDAATYLAALFGEVLTRHDFSPPVWVAGRETLKSLEEAHPGPTWPELGTVLAKSLANIPAKGLPSIPAPERIGDGQTTLSVLGRALAAVSGWENWPASALLRAVNHTGRSALTGALAGALLGARTGIPGLPQKWVDQLELRHLVENVATDVFWHFDQPPALRARPEEWPERYPRW